MMTISSCATISLRTREYALTGVRFVPALVEMTPSAEQTATKNVKCTMSNTWVTVAAGDLPPGDLWAPLRMPRAAGLATPGLWRELPHFPRTAAAPWTLRVQADDAGRPGNLGSGHLYALGRLRAAR